MAATAEAPVLQVGLLATMPDGSLRFVGEDGQIQTIVPTKRFDVLREEAKLDTEGCKLDVFDKLRRMHNRVVMIDCKRPDPHHQMLAKLKDYILPTLIKRGHLRAHEVREHYGFTIGEDLMFEQALTYAFGDIRAVIGFRP